MVGVCLNALNFRLIKLKRGHESQHQIPLLVVAYFKTQMQLAVPSLFTYPLLGYFYMIEICVYYRRGNRRA